MDRVSHRQRDGPPGEPVVHRIVTEIATREGTDPTEMEPIAGAIDVDALEALFDGPPTFSGHVSFTYSGYEVTVAADGGVTVAVEAT